METNEGSIQFEHSLDHVLEFFSKAGSIFDTNEPGFYNNKEDILDLFQRSWIVDKELTLKVLFWLRDCRGGAGNRSGFRRCIKWLAKNKEYYKWVDANIHLIPEHGRWDDMRSLFSTNVEDKAAGTWAHNIIYHGDVLAAKWAKRTDIPIYLKLKNNGLVKNMGEFRRLLSRVRSNHIVESKMCKGEWDKIEYSHVPSVAMSRYNNAFVKNDLERFEQFKEDVKNNKKEIKASVLFPHDCVRTWKNGDKDIANSQFNALPNYIDSNKNIMVLADSSYSMNVNIAGSIKAMDVSKGLALYTSSKINKDNPFYKRFLMFESESKLVSWDGMSFSDVLYDDNIFDGAIGSTRIDIALDTILKTAVFYHLSQDKIPDMLLICSDMQFSSGSASDETEVEKSLKKWDDAGYKRPTIVYWNLYPYGGQPSTKQDKNVCMVSGFSPSILKSILSCVDFDPISIMMSTLEKYKISSPYVG